MAPHRLYVHPPRKCWRKMDVRIARLDTSCSKNLSLTTYFTSNLSFFFVKVKKLICSVCYFYYFKRRFPCFSHTRESINHSMFSTMRPERCVSFIYWPLSWASQMSNDEWSSPIRSKLGRCQYHNMPLLILSAVLKTIYPCVKIVDFIALPFCDWMLVPLDTIIGNVPCFLSRASRPIYLVPTHSLASVLVHRGPDEHLNIWYGS
jgi:hypothetical protein